MSTLASTRIHSIRPGLRSTVAVLVGLVWGTAAIAKFWNLRNGVAFAYSPIWLVSGIACIELWLCCQLLIDRLNSRSILLVSILFASCLTIASVVFALLGTTCACVGIELPIGLTIGWNLFSLSILSAILWFQRPASGPSAVGLMQSMAIFFLVGCSIGLSPLANMLGWERAETVKLVLLESSELSGETRPGGQLKFCAHVKNVSNQSVRIVGGGSGCGCITLQSIPIEIPAQATRELDILISSQSRTGDYEWQVEYYLDANRHFYFPFSVNYHVSDHLHKE